MAVDKQFYNEASAAKLGWDPTWFGHDAFDEKLTRIIRKWQKDRGLAADGMCGRGRSASSLTKGKHRSLIMCLLTTTMTA